MCQSHPGPEITQEYLNSLAALANYTLPTPAALQATTLPNGWEPVPGEVPAPYKAELYDRHQRRRRRTREPAAAPPPARTVAAATWSSRPPPSRYRTRLWITTPTWTCSTAK